MLNDKLGSGDLNWMFVIIFILLGTSTFLTFTSDLTGVGETERSVNALRNETAEGFVVESNPSFLDALAIPFQIIGTVFKITFWTFGFQYFILSLFFDILVLLLFVVGYRQIRSGGG